MIDEVKAWLRENIPKMASYSKSDIYNTDETALFYQMLPAKTHTLKVDTYAGGKNSKQRTTVLFCTDMGIVGCPTSSENPESPAASEITCLCATGTTAKHE